MIKMKIKWTIVFVLVCILFSIGSVLAMVNTDRNGIAIKGYDPVAYFTLNRPVPGKETYQFQWNGAKWLFSSEEHLELFQKKPVKYAPQYGGY